MTAQLYPGTIEPTLRHMVQSSGQSVRILVRRGEAALSLARSFSHVLKVETEIEYPFCGREDEQSRRRTDGSRPRAYLLRAHFPSA